MRGIDTNYRFGAALKVLLTPHVSRFNRKEMQPSLQLDMTMAQLKAPLMMSQETQKRDGETWLTGDALMRQTGISKRDLIRFVRLGVLPTSMLRLSAAGGGSSRKVSYFSASIIGHIAMLKRLRDKGHGVDEIATELRKAAEKAKQLEDRPVQNSLSNEPSIVNEPHKKHKPPHVHLPVGAISASAFYINHDLRIGWIRVNQDDRLSAAIRDEIADDPFGTVFDIMLRASLKELVLNWHPLFSFTYRFLQKTTAPYRFNRLAPTISLNLEKKNQLQVTSPGDAGNGLIDSCPIPLVDRQGRVQIRRIYGLAISEGTLFVLDEEHWQDVHSDKVVDETVSAPSVKTDSGPRKRPFSVISVRIDNSRSIVETLLPETYFQLMKRIWAESDRILSARGGQRVNRSGTDVQYMIPKQTDTDPAYDAICCAIELKNTIREIEASLKAKGEWYSDIRLNIGISSGCDHLQQEDLTASMAFMLPGSAADQAIYLSAIAHAGAIWITKSALGHLEPQQMKRITFGIYRDDKLIRNIFTQVSDLPCAPTSPPPERGIRSLSVTRIIDLQSGPSARTA